MKTRIKQKLRESLLLTEKIFDLDSDVNMIYDKYFKYYIDYVAKYRKMTDLVKGSFKSEELTSKLAKKANEINPVTIIINDSKSAYSSSYYNPTEQIISISYNKEAINFVFDNENSLDVAKTQLPLNMRNSLEHEFKESVIKGSIHHELAHWIDDTLNNNHIKKTLAKNQNKRIKNINTHYLEIQGQIHNVKQLHNEYSEIWDDLTFDELISKSPALNSINNKLNGDLKKMWLRKLKTRMYRENLLGKNMA